MLQTGKLDSDLLKSLIFGKIRYRNDDVKVRPGIGEDCAVVGFGEYDCIMSTDPITGTVQYIGRLAVHVTANDLAASGAEPVGIMLTALLPPETEEEAIRRMVQDAEAVCKELDMEILGGHTEITDVVKQPVLTASGIGFAPEGQLLDPQNVRPGDHLILSKWIGLEATSILASEHREQLLTRLPAELIDTAAGFAKYISVVKDAAAAKRAGVHAMHDVTEGGIFGALWEIAEAAGCGLTVDVRKIPVRQETIEICEYFDVNPYQIMSSGSMLIAAPDGPAVVIELQKQGIPAAVIGKITGGNDRILKNGENVRYLDRPKPDELYRVK